MAKSTRSKVKRHFRAKKREDGVYAATEAARLNRLHKRLAMVTKTDKDGDIEVEDVEAVALNEDHMIDDEQPTEDLNAEGGEGMMLDPTKTDEVPKRVSTHGPRGSRREQWRLSKGLPVNSGPRKVNRQGALSAKRKAGRSHRRR